MSNNEYIWAHNKADNSFAYLSKSLEIILKNEVENNFNLLDIGCGNGFLTKDMSRYFKKVIGIDNSNSAISQAKKNYSGNINFINAKIENLENYQPFNCITLIEVIEHLYSPDDILQKIYQIANNDTKIIISTPFHGFIKNLLILISGKFDKHFTPLWEHGHIKFFSKNTLKQLIERNNFKIVKTYYSGRFYPISKSIISVLQKLPK